MQALSESVAEARIVEGTITAIAFLLAVIAVVTLHLPHPPKSSGGVSDSDEV